MPNSTSDAIGKVTRTIQKNIGGALYEVSGANYTILDDDVYTTIHMTTGAANRTVTLPTAADNLNRRITLIKVDSGAGHAILDGEGAETINGTTDVNLISQYDRITVISDDDEWFVLEHYIHYDTGWVANSDWTNRHLGTAAGGDVVHNLDANLSELFFRILWSADGSDTSCQEISNSMMYSSATNSYWGIGVIQVDKDNIRVQTGSNGVTYVRDADGQIPALTTQSDYYKVVVERRIIR